MNALVSTRAGSASLAPQTWGEAQQFAALLAQSTMVPKDFQGKPGNIMVALQWGAEVGLGPLQAVQNIAVINGRPTIWGDAALALVRAHPACASIQEGVEGEGDARHGFCEVTRRGEKPQRRTFSVADAKKASLWGKPGPWQQYPDRMLQLRARGFAIRDVFPDALRGVITAEEAQDMPTHPEARGPVVDVTPQRQEVAADPWPMFGPDMTERNAKDSRQWVTWCRAAVSKLESPEAVVSWRNEMEQHFEALQSRDADAVEAVNAAVTDRLDALASAHEGEAA